MTTLTTFSIRLDPVAMSRFDAIAAGQGGRSALLRQLIATQITDAARAEPEVGEGGLRDRTIRIHLSASEAAVVAEHARGLAITPARWISLLVRRRIRIGPRVDFGWRVLLIDIRRQLRGVARNLNQATRAVNAAMMEDSGLDLSREVGRLLEMRMEVAEQVGAMDTALLADYAYWQVPA
jgi:hypothetical protein